ncbi:MAG: ABC transporter permease [Alistipes indistinctus]
MIEADTSVLRKPAYALISSSMAERLYGTEPALDKQFTYAGTTFTVGGVYRDFPRNSQLKNGFYFQFRTETNGRWGNLELQRTSYPAGRSGPQRGGRGEPPAKLCPQTGQSRPLRYRLPPEPALGCFLLERRGRHEPGNER